MNKVFKILFFFALVLVAWTLWNNFYAGKSINPVGLKQLNGTIITLPDQKKLTLVSFWSVYCPPCRKELPQLQQFYLNRQDKLATQFQIVTIAMPYDDLKDVRILQQELNLTLPISLDTDGIAVTAFSQKMLTPAYYLIDTNGKILFQKYGIMEMETLQQTIKKYL